MFFEQRSLEPNIGAAYFWLRLIHGGRDLQSHALEDWMENGYRSLKVMDMHLSKHDYFVDGRYTIADIALYGFAHVADQCDFDLGRYPAVRDWLARVAAEPGYVPMDWQRQSVAAGIRRDCPAAGRNPARAGLTSAVNLSLTIKATKTPRFQAGSA